MLLLVLVRRWAVAPSERAQFVQLPFSQLLAVYPHKNRKCGRVFMGDKGIRVNVMGVNHEFPYCERLEALKMKIAQEYTCFCNDVQIYRKKGNAEKGQLEVVPASTKLNRDDAFEAAIANFVAVPVTFDGTEKTVLMDSSLKVINLAAAVTNSGTCDCRVNDQNVEPSTLLADLCGQLGGNRLVLGEPGTGKKIHKAVDLLTREFTADMFDNSSVAWLRFRLSQEFKIPLAELIIKDGDRVMDDTEEACKAERLSVSSMDIDVYVDLQGRKLGDRFRKLKVNLLDTVWDVKLQASTLLGIDKPEKLQLLDLPGGLPRDEECIGAAGVYNGMYLTCDDCNDKYCLTVSDLDGKEYRAPELSGKTEVRVCVLRAKNEALKDDERVTYKGEDVTDRRLSQLEYDPLERLKLIIALKQIYVRSERQTYPFDREVIKDWKVRDLINEVLRRENISLDTKCELLDEKGRLDDQKKVPLKTRTLSLKIIAGEQRQRPPAQTPPKAFEVIFQEGDKTLYQCFCDGDMSLRDLKARIGLPDEGVRFFDAEKREITGNARIESPKVVCVATQENPMVLNYSINEQDKSSHITVGSSDNVRDLKMKYVRQKAQEKVNWNFDLLFFEHELDITKTFRELCIPNNSCLKVRTRTNTVSVRVSNGQREKTYEMSQYDTIDDLCQLIEALEEIPADSFSLKDTHNVVVKRNKPISETEHKSFQIERFPTVNIGLITGDSTKLQVNPDQTIAEFLTEYQGKMGGTDRFGLFCKGRMLPSDQTMRDVLHKPAGEIQLGKLDQIRVKWNRDLFTEYLCLDTPLGAVLDDLNDKHKWIEGPATDLIVKYDGWELQGEMTLNEVMGESFKPLEILPKPLAKESSPPRPSGKQIPTVSPKQHAAGGPAPGDSVILPAWIDDGTRSGTESVTVKKTDTLSTVRSLLADKLRGSNFDRARFRYSDENCTYSDVVPEETQVQNLRVPEFDLVLVKDDEGATDVKPADDFSATLTTSMRRRVDQPKDAPNPRLECKFTVQRPGESTSQIITRHFDNTARISDAKHILSEEFGVPVDYITLLFGGRPLTNGMLLSRIRLHNKSITVYIKDISEIILVTAKGLRPTIH